MSSRRQHTNPDQTPTAPIDIDNTDIDQLTPATPNTAADQSHEQQTQSAGKFPWLGNLAARRVAKRIGGELYFSTSNAIHGSHDGPDHKPDASYNIPHKTAATAAAIHHLHAVEHSKVISWNAKIADSLAPKGSKREDLIKKTSKEVARTVTHVEIDTGSLSQTEQAWLQTVSVEGILNPTNLVYLREKIVASAVSRGVLEETIRKKILTGGLLGMAPGELAAYLNISMQTLRNQNEHQAERAVPKVIIDKMNQLLRLPLALPKVDVLKELGERLGSTAGQSTDPNESPIVRIGMYDEAVSRQPQITRQPQQTTAPTRSSIPSSRPAPARTPTKTKAGGETSKISAEDEQVLLAIDARVSATIRERAPDWGLDYDDPRFPDMAAEVRAEIYREHFGADFSDEAIEKVFSTIKKLTSRPKK